MRHLLTAVLIATALASPIKAEVLEMQCTYPNGEPITFVFDTEQQTVFQLNQDEDMETQVLIWNDHVIGWTNLLNDDQFSMIRMLMLDRATLRLQSSWLANLVPGLASLDELVQCVRPI
ncbi:hypothetical protein [Roseobacter sp. HKCCA0882]|uniref:hypothetical protein n=1 Tax=Roseobacter sp. HKCCA0882 TaxID=3120337 RepID=UPI0030EB5AE6